MCNENGPANRKGCVCFRAIQSFAWQPAVSRPDYGATESLSAWSVDIYFTLRAHDS